MEINKIEETIKNLTEVFFEAGKLSIELRNKGLTESFKKDKTPVTNGDIEVNNVITSSLKKITPKIPIVSEEAIENKNLNLDTFWLVDPIDGTYDYINDGEEFTINAGLILNEKAVAGLINVPAKNRMFYSFGKNQSFEITSNKTIKLDCKKKLMVLIYYMKEVVVHFFYTKQHHL